VQQQQPTNNNNNNTPPQKKLKKKKKPDLDYKNKLPHAYVQPHFFQLPILSGIGRRNLALTEKFRGNEWQWGTDLNSRTAGLFAFVSYGS
jgi:hypothetical protein